MRDHVELKMTLNNRIAAPLSDLRVQMCAMLKAARGFEQQTNDNKILEPPFAACHDASEKMDPLSDKKHLECGNVLLRSFAKDNGIGEDVTGVFRNTPCQQS